MFPVVDTQLMTSAVADCRDSPETCDDVLPDLCSCSMDVVEEVDERDKETPFEYPRDRFNL